MPTSSTFWLNGRVRTVPSLTPREESHGPAEEVPHEQRPRAETAQNDGAASHWLVHTAGDMRLASMGKWVLGLVIAVSALAVAVLWPYLDGHAETMAARAWRRAGTDAAAGRITPDTIDQLTVAWTYQTGDVSAYAGGRAGTAFQSTPTLLDETLYFVTPFSRVVALDAATGQERWTFDPSVDRSDGDGRMTTQRGVAVWRDVNASADLPCTARVFAASFDARLFAIDANTGALCAAFASGGAIDLKRGVPRIEVNPGSYKVAVAPIVVGDLVVVGSSLTDNLDARAPSGVLRAFDVRTGALRWAWEPVAKLGGADASGAWLESGAANVWAGLAADTARDLLFVPTSSASPDHYGGLRPGPNLYANSIVALRVSTGEIVWHFQTVHHDLWDYDLAAPPALITIRRAGGDVPAVVVGTKLGYLFVLHRETGAPLFPIEERPVPQSDVPGEQSWPTQPMPVRPRPLTGQGLFPNDAWGLTWLDRAACRRRIEQLRHDGAFAPPSVRGTVVMPGFLGGLQWGGGGWDPDRQLYIVNVIHLAMVLTLIPREEVEQAESTSAADGAFYVAPQRRTPYGVKREALLSPLGIPCTPPPWGTLAAVDMVSGDVRWEVPFGTLRDLVGFATPKAWGSPSIGGPVVANGLAFIGGTMDRRIRAFDVQSGAQVWEDTLPASAQSTPLLYQAGGRQMLVIAAGGHALMHSTLGDSVVAYAVRESRAAGGQ